MSFKVATVQFSNDKNCFATLPSDCFSQISRHTEIPVFEVSVSDTHNIYISSKYNQAVSQGDKVVVNGLYGNKLGLKDSEEVIIRPYPNVPLCNQVSIEPLSVNDWEILERNAAFVESNLMDQIRVVWRGQIFPVWVERNICIFLKIGTTEPSANCVILCNETEVIVSPKSRTDIASHKAAPAEKAPVKKPDFFPDNELDEKELKNPSIHENEDEEIYPKKKSSKEKISPSRWNWKDWMPWLMGSSQAEDTEEFITEPGPMDKARRKLSVDQSHYSLQGGTNLTFRVQSLIANFDIDSSSNHTDELDGDTGESDICWSLQDPTLVFVNREDIIEQFEGSKPMVPEMFLARFMKLMSPKEMEKEASKLRKQTETEKSQEKKTNSKMSDKKKEELLNDKPLEAVVKVIVIDKKREMSSRKVEEVVSAVLCEQQCYRGHIVVPCLLRRLLALEVSSRVWIKVTEGGPVVPSKYELYPVGSVPLSVSNQMIQMALKNWVKYISTKQFPFLIFNGVAVRIPVFLGTYKHVEMQIVIADSNIVKPDVRFPYGVMHPGNLNEVPLYVMNNSNGDKEQPKWPVQPMLQYTDVASIDPPFPTIQLHHLGGMDRYTSDALYHIDMCLGTKPVADCMFRLTSPGLRNGMLLITGPKGVGKTSFAKALCRKLGDPPNLAHFSFMDCKPLRGKRPDSVVKMISMLFEEAAWRQPAVVLLDDLDHVAPAPTGPEAEFSAEAVYGARIAEVFKDVMRHEIGQGSRIAVIATCTSRSTIHPLLVNTRGTHFVQEFIDIPPPDKDGRQEILKTILTNRPSMSPDTVKELKWDVLKSKTEGYVACDLESLVSRALHAHHIRNRKSSNEAEVVLTHEDFETAFNGFTPSSIRNVPLHTAGDVGWEDVGGLTDVKSILEETLLYPSKYPELFANCPLRLRSGILLYGAPGTGKTLLAGVLAKECGLNFISIKGPELLSKYIGASEQAVRDNFVRAQSAKPCILFFDEFDSIAPRRGHDNTGVTDRVVNQLLTQLDGVEGLQGVYVLAATSRPDLIDPALLRPGRLDKCVKCEIPNQKERLKIFESLTRKMTISSDVDLSYFAEKCEYFTGADVKALLYNAQLEAIHEVTGKLKGDLSSRKTSRGNARKRPSPRKSQTCLTLKKGVTIDSCDSDKKVLYIQKLEEGIKVISEEMEEKLVSQVEHIQARLMVKKSLEHISTSENLFSPVAASKPPLVQVRQTHMLAALEQTRPSVGLEERNRYRRIYENFLSSRGADFGEIPKDNNMRQTLA